MTAPIATLAPSHPLTIPNTAPPPGVSTPASRFILFGDEWLHLQTYITQALQLPINGSGWDEKYGSFSDQGEVTKVLGAMTAVQALSSTFGNPNTLRQEIANNPGYLLSPTAPAEIYGNIVWLASQIEDAAGTFNYTFENLRDLLSPSAGTPEERANNLKTILVGPGGLTSTAQDMEKKTQELLKKLAAFDIKVNAANEELVKYTSAESTIVADAKTLVAQDEIKRDELKKAAEEALQKWREYTIAAVASSVGVMVLTGGLLWPVAVGLGVGLGVAAAKERALYNTFMKEVAAEEVEIGKKNRLLVDLTGLNTAIVPVASALRNFTVALQEIEGVWVDIGLRLNHVVTDYSVDQLSDLPWVTQAFDIENAIVKWHEIAETSKQFTQSSLVSYDSSVSWGGQLPETRAA